MLFRKDPNAPPRQPGRWSAHLLGATCEPDNRTPSSARLYAMWLIGFVLLAQFLIIDVLVWKILTLDASGPNAVGLATVYAGVLRVFMLWSMLFDVATALSLYGINVWKYVAAMRTGQVLREDDDGTPTGIPRAIPRVSPIPPVARPRPVAPPAAPQPRPAHVDEPADGDRVE